MLQQHQRAGANLSRDERLAVAGTSTGIMPARPFVVSTPESGFVTTAKPGSQDVCAYLARLLATPHFTSASRRGQLLDYLVRHTLAGDAHKLNEYRIALDVFRKPSSFDPSIESLVRTEFSRLRRRLKQYYAEGGRNDAIVIDFPPRSYAATFEFREPAAPQKLPPVLQLVPASAKAASRPWLRIAFVAVSLVALIAAVALLSWRQYEKQLARQPIHSIVVLPFENYSPHNDDEYAADGMTEELTSNLAQGRDLQVVARTSAFAFKGRGEDVREIGRQLNVDAVLEGSLTRDGGRMRITARLNRAYDGYHLWSHSYETDSNNLLEVQEEVANSIAAAIKQAGTRGSASRVSAMSTKLESRDQIAASF
jgi:TolB-like protein